MGASICRYHKAESQTEIEAQNCNMESRNIVPLVWDPACPSTLLTVDPLCGDDRMFCKAFEPERVALTQILQALQDYYQDENKSLASVLDLLRSYQVALVECNSADAWSDACSSEEQQERKTWLSMMHDIMHVCQVFLPLVVPTGNNVHHDSRMELPGAATAEMVRYLRYHRCSFLDGEVYNALFEDATQPEHHPDYWILVQKLVMRGCLQQAWQVLSRHSLFRAILHDHVQIQEAFLQVRELLLRAPLPGGRTDEFDLDQEVASMQEEDEEISPVYFPLLDVSASDYRFWEASRTFQADFDFPLVYVPEAARRKWQLWQECVLNARPRLIRALRIVVPQIEPLLDIMTGNFTSVTFESWGEQLCTELLYKTPDLRPRNLSNRTKQIKGKYQEEDTWAEYVIKIMQGNFIAALEPIMAIGEGAALPCTLVVLLYDLFLESQVLSPELAFRKHDFLANAAISIKSSLARSHPDIGVQLAVRLLSPFCKQEGALSVAQVIHSVLETYAPSSDTFALTILSICRPLLEEEKNVVVLDGCISALLYRYEDNMRQENFDAAYDVLVHGYELEQLVLSLAPQVGVAYRRLFSECIELSFSLLAMMTEKSAIDVAKFRKAKSLLTTRERHQIHIESILELAVLDRLVTAMASNDDAIKASGIIYCLEDCVMKDGGVGTRAPLNMHWHLLQLAQMTMRKYDNDVFAAEFNIRAVFDKRGILILMRRLLELTTLQEYPEDGVAEIKKSLNVGLAASYFVQNAQKTNRTHWKLKLDKTGMEAGNIKDCDLHKYPSATREQFVDYMLDGE